MRKILKTATSVLLGRVTSGTGPGEELTPSQVRSLLNVYTTTQTDSAISTAVNSLVAGAPGLLDTLDELSAALGDDANFASTVTTALAGKVDSSSLSESIDDRVAALLTAGTNITITYNDAANTLTIASTAGGLSGTGSVDNAVLRADGTGGATLQNSAWIIADNATASPNNTVNHASLQATGATSNVSVSIVPKGTGAFCLRVPDGTTTGGNARGENAIDLQTLITGASQVASGTYAIVIGAGNTASGSYSIAIGRSCSATASGAIALGDFATASGERAFATALTTASGANSFAHGANSTVANNTNAVAVGYTCTASGAFSQAFGLQATADRYNQYSHGGGVVGSLGCGYSRFVLGAKTTNATPLGMYLNGTIASVLLTVPSGKAFAFTARIIGIKSDGSAVADFMRRGVIKNVGGTTSLAGSIQTLGTDIEDNASTDIAITADNTNDALSIAVTGITAETWRWVAVVEGVEIVYGT